MFIFLLLRPNVKPKNVSGKYRILKLRVLIKTSVKGNLLKS